MTKTVFTRPRTITLSRRRLLGLASGATVFTFWQRRAHAFPAAERYVDRVAAERIADHDPARPPILVDAQTHVWWRAGGIRQLSDRGEHFLKSLAGSRAAVVGHPVPVADMGRVMDWLAAREADLLPVGYFHLVFTLPVEIAPIAYQNKSVAYDLLFRTGVRDIAHHRRRSKASRRSHRHHGRAPHLGLGDDP